MNATDTLALLPLLLLAGTAVVVMLGIAVTPESRANGRTDAHRLCCFFSIDLRGCSAGSA